MPRCCCVPKCYNNNEIRKCFHIPKILRVQKVWQEVIDRLDLKSCTCPYTYLVCEEHFTEDCFGHNGSFLKYSLPTLKLPGYCRDVNSADKFSSTICAEKKEVEFNNESGPVFQDSDISIKRIENLKTYSRKKFSEKKCLAVGTGGPLKDIEINNTAELSNERVAGQKNEFEGDKEPSSLNLEWTPGGMTESNENLQIINEKLSDTDSESTKNHGWSENCVQNSRKRTSQNLNSGESIKKKKYEYLIDKVSLRAVLKKNADEKKDELAEEHIKKMEILEKVCTMKIKFIEDEQRKQMEILEEERIKRMTLLEEEHKKRLELQQAKYHVEMQYIEEQNRIKENIRLLEQQILVEKRKKK